ncbi:hypothetical protein ATI61_103551 [Archangium gephyra]|uniref:Uncharacterized protein n=1 Tax=Archangium gephyra TaxID=48 RepID=A0AAC8Q772_9BACT|nr:hypothetical protein [Archangium gephyra]AKJ01836.1 Hypothetical protein AA314_03462 [Archangium gephyra]REG34644.1 hypothetical protein ATI61_103551 [Archangium gephyra]
MTALVILTAYAVLGGVAALCAFVQKRGSPLVERLGQAMLTLALWPFLLPVLLSPGDAALRVERGHQSARARRLDEVTGRLEECWRQAAVESSWAADQAREHRLLDGFVGRLRTQEKRLLEMEAALASAPASVKERLNRLYEHASAELEHSIGLVEELAAQLTLLRFSGLGNPSATRVERSHIEELLLRIEALAEASQPTPSEAPPPAQVARA